ncbi:hypothetical protein ABZ958_03400 [Streptomyces sp. NPDC046237]|uniref:hypothetical protein n=1 Tax=Streptomyces sp. NPDC046237 TaxID=3154914 RepID=UPI00340E659C
MAVGQLTHLADAVTLSTNSSASVTVPNDGSVVVGDLLLAACVMPSGSRTFAISGGAGAWTSLGTAMQAGHMSQLWWRIAEAGDLAAAITVTPSTGNIRQALLLGRIRGVLAASPIAAATNTSATAATKTTPTLGSVGAASREVGVVWDSRGATSPNTSAWTAPSGHTRRGQAFTTAGSGSCSGAWGDADSTGSGTFGSRVWSADQSALGSAWTLAIAPGEQAIIPVRIGSTAAVPPPTLSPGPVTLQPSRIGSTTALYSPALTPGAVTLTPAFLSPAAVLHAPSLNPGAVTLSPGWIASTTTIGSPSVGAFDQDITVTIGDLAAGWAVSRPSLSWEVRVRW